MGIQNSKNKQRKPAKQSHRYSRLWKWSSHILLGLVALIVVLMIWFRISPWPGAMLIRHVFDEGGAKTTESLDKHAPQGIAVISNQQYVSGDKEAKLDVYMPETAQATNQKLPVVIWTHGGAWLSGDKAEAGAYYKLIAQAGYIVVAPDYSLAPEYTYPRAVHQLNSMYAYLKENANRFHADTDKIVLAGDSAGSQLSAQMAALITNPAYAKEVGITPHIMPAHLKGVVLNCGIYKMEDLAHPNPAVSRLLGWGDDVTVWAYSGTHDFSDPIIRQMSPYYHVTKDFPPAFITGGNDDPLTNVQSRPFSNQLESLGVSVTRLFYEPNHTPALPHEYQFNLDIREGQEALKQILEFLHEHTQ